MSTKDDLDQAVEQARAALALEQHPPEDSDRSTVLFDLANALSGRFSHLYIFTDLEEAITLYRAVIELHLPDNPRRPRCLSNLANNLHDRFLLRGIETDLDEAIELNRAALELCHPSHPDRYACINTLTLTLLSQFSCRGIRSALDEAIELSQAALELYLPGDPGRSTSLNSLASGLSYRLQLGGPQSDIDKGIELSRAALELCPPGHLERSLSMHTCAISLLTRCLLQSDDIESDLHEGIELERAALDLRPPGHPGRSMSLKSLANGLLIRLQYQGQLSDLDEAIALYRAALELHPPGHLSRSGSLFSLANGLSARSQLQDLPSDLDAAIELTRGALELRPHGHSERGTTLSSLANCFWIRFEQQGQSSDLDSAIELHRAASDLCPSDHPERPLYLINLAVCLLARFQQHGSPSDLDEATELHQAALELLPPTHPSRPTSLNNLANYFWARFEQRGLLSDLDSAIEQHRAVLELRPPGHPDRPSSLASLAPILYARFEQKGLFSDLDEAIESNRVVLQLYPAEHPNRPVALNNLAENLQARFEHQHLLSDLEDAIKLSRDALELCAPGHPERPMFLNILAKSLDSRFREQGLQSDLDEAIDVSRSALERCHAGHQVFGRIIRQLGELLLRKAPEERAVEEAFSQYSKLSDLTSYGVSRDTLSAAESWAHNAEKFEHSSVLDAYRTSLVLLDRLLTVAPSVSLRHRILKANISTLAADAFSCAVRRGELTTAVAILEQGRTMLWAQLARFRTPLEDLAASGDAGKALAEEFRRLSFQLRKAAEVAVSEQETSQVRQLTGRWEELVQHIRDVPRFARFLLPPLFSDLRKAAKGGPIIIVNTSKYSCDALIILTASEPIHVPLNIVKEHVSQLSSRFRDVTKSAIAESERREVMFAILHELWTIVVNPIVHKLPQNDSVRSRHIWWCPTGEFTALPLHAAGPYTAGMKNLNDIYLSSYTPTLGALLRARRSAKASEVGQQCFAAIGQPNPYEGTPLPSVPKEIEIVAGRISDAVSFTRLVGDAATVDSALKELTSHQWAHLACHGRPNLEHPFSSSFAMHDGPLLLTQIIQAELQNPEFAFLSACHTAAYNESTPDEAIHLAAGMQFAGFRSVVGTMWAVDDTVVCRVVSAFYKNVFDKSGRLDSKRVALALHKAVTLLQQDAAVPFEQRIVFIHIGV